MAETSKGRPINVFAVAWKKESTLGRDPYNTSGFSIYIEKRKKKEHVGGGASQPTEEKVSPPSERDVKEAYVTKVILKTLALLGREPVWHFEVKND